MVDDEEDDENKSTQEKEKENPISDYKNFTKSQEEKNGGENKSNLPKKDFAQKFKDYCDYLKNKYPTLYKIGEFTANNPGTIATGAAIGLATASPFMMLRYIGSRWARQAFVNTMVNLIRQRYNVDISRYAAVLERFVDSRAVRFNINDEMINALNDIGNNNLGNELINILNDIQHPPYNPNDYYANIDNEEALRRWQREHE